MGMPESLQLGYASVGFGGIPQNAAEKACSAGRAGLGGIPKDGAEKACPAGRAGMVSACI